MQRFFSKFLIIICLLALLYLNRSDESIACGGYNNEMEYDVLFSNKTLLNHNFDYYSMFFKNFEALDSRFNSNTKYDYYQEFDNILQWMEDIKFIDSSEFQYYSKDNNFNNLNTKHNLKKLYDEFEYVIYKSNNYRINQMQNYVKNKEYKLTSNFVKNNLLLNHLKQQNDTLFFKYLLLAKNIENLMNLDSNIYPYYWRTSKYLDSNSIKTKYKLLVKTCENHLKNTKNENYKIRFAFQLCKLCFYYNRLEFDRVFYNFFNEENRNLLYYWAMEYKAGIELRKKNKSEANYLYCQIFTNCRSLRINVLESIKLNSKKDFDNLLAKCKTNNEKSAVYAIRATHKENDAASELENIYNFNPNSEFIEFLLLKEIIILEKLINRKDQMIIYNHDDNFNKLKYLKYTNFYKIKKFVNKVIQERKFNNLDFILVIDAYLEFMSNNFEKSNRIVESCLEKSNLSESVKKQFLIIKLVLNLEKNKFIDNQFENETFDILQQIKFFNKSPRILDLKITKEKSFEIPSVDKTWEYCLEKLSYKYFLQGDIAKSNLCINTFSEIKSKPNLVLLNQLIALIQKQDKNEFEKYLIKSTGINLQELIEIKGTVLLNDCKYAYAIKEFEKLKSKYKVKSKSFNLSVNPFDLENYTNKLVESKNKKYTKLSFAKKMQELEHQMLFTFDTNELSKVYIDYTNALLNTTYYGTSWYTLDYFHTNSFEFRENDYILTSDYILPKDINYYRCIKFHDTSYFDIPKFKRIIDQFKYLNCDDNLKAKFVFIKAKFNFQDQTHKQVYFNYWLNYTYNYSPILSGNDYHYYYYILNTVYSNTDFYKEAYNNCSYFRDYVDLY